MKIEQINELFARFAGQLLRRRWLVLAAFALVIVLSVIDKNSEAFVKLKYSF